jgi:hypothetical protein
MKELTLDYMYEFHEDDWIPADNPLEKLTLRDVYYDECEDVLNLLQNVKAYSPCLKTFSVNIYCWLGGIKVSLLSWNLILLS